MVKHLVLIHFHDINFNNSSGAEYCVTLMGETPLLSFLPSPFFWILVIISPSLHLVVVGSRFLGECYRADAAAGSRKVRFILLFFFFMEVLLAELPSSLTKNCSVSPSDNLQKLVFTLSEKYRCITHPLEYFVFLQKMCIKPLSWYFIVFEVIYYNIQQSVNIAGSRTLSSLQLVFLLSIWIGRSMTILVWSGRVNTTIVNIQIYSQ